jgi:RNA polymerase-binding transcription factor
MVEEWRNRLLALREELESIADTGDESAAVVELDQSKVGRLSRMDAMQAQAMAKASSQRREAALKQISAALKRLEEGDFGLCLKCDQPINPKRLAFDPTATLCIDCASAAESSDFH